MPYLDDAIMSRYVEMIRIRYVRIRLWKIELLYCNIYFQLTVSTSTL